MASPDVKSASRAFAILEIFQETRCPHSMSDLARRLDCPRSSATMLLKTLVKLGYLNYDRRSRNYFPTPKVARLGDWVPRALFGSGQIIDAMNDVHAATGESVFVGAQNDVYLQYIQTRESKYVLRFHIDEGTIRPITHSIAGLMLIADLPPDRLENIVRRANIATLDTGDRVRLEDVIARVGEIRRRGYAYVENMPFEGGATLAIRLPIMAQGQQLVLAIGGALPRFRSNHAAYLAALQAAVASLRPDGQVTVPGSDVAEGS